MIRKAIKRIKAGAIHENYEEKFKYVYLVRLSFFLAFYFDIHTLITHICTIHMTYFLSISSEAALGKQLFPRPPNAQLREVYSKQRKLELGEAFYYDAPLKTSSRQGKRPSEISEL